MLVTPVNLALLIVNQLTAPQNHWFLWPLLIWGGVLALRVIKLFLLRGQLARWEQARLQEILRR
ncbi:MULTISPECIES: 2TM domain-containing protein [Lonsdalea]|uniref:Uncharacterized protein n=2 Tax=Lonsdalea TaxID=1082702 RepID=A0ACD1J895_9GAMM|nr:MULTISPECIES: 2TM domain-containing protein [Lonsdalea]OSM94245.1 hypothetical protein AU499_16450 [Lonsdalea populi]OSM95254.1 hypothetical protein AU508_12215 [Lonsdalea populi]QPQ24090.1 2TM domain-containing protein [Lonsdalea populi]RAT10181.1 hypothetical protein AU485_16810 [Lonsdalea quercina]RAT12549.1 hypothetical protein AU486_15905 [Lonsdalea quercina]